MTDKNKELPVGCAGCQSTLPCLETCGGDPFAEREQSQETGEAVVRLNNLLGGDLFKDGVLYYEKQLYDLLQSKGWGDVCAARIVSEMAEIVAKKIDT